MGLGSLGDLNWSRKKKWRWLIEFFMDGNSTGEPKFVKINARPDSGGESLNFHNLWIPKGSALAPFNEVVLTLIDSCEIPLETWTLKEAKLLYLDHDTLDEEDCFAGSITHTDVVYQNMI